MTRNTPEIVLRSLRLEDLGAALAVQSECHPRFLLEGEQAFASRLAVAASYCLAATLDDALVGYLLAHGWPSQSPPALGTVLVQEGPSEVLYVHDLAVAAAGRGLGIGRMLVARAFEMADSDGLRSAELIAVEAAVTYWRNLGFSEPAILPALAAKVALYGVNARWMTAPIVT